MKTVITLSDHQRLSAGDGGRVSEEASEGTLKEPALQGKLICVSWNQGGGRDGLRFQKRKVVEQRDKAGAGEVVPT